MIFILVIFNSLYYLLGMNLFLFLCYIQVVESLDFSALTLVKVVLYVNNCLNVCFCGSMNFEVSFSSFY